MKAIAPTDDELASELGAALDVWIGIVAMVAAQYEPTHQEWSPSKSSFGKMCLLKHKKRTLLYLTPEKEGMRVAIVLGERAAGLALAGKIPEKIKVLIREAKPYAEGRGIRFAVTSAKDIRVLSDLLAIKTAPK